MQRAIIIDPHKREVREVTDDFEGGMVLKEYIAQGERGDKLAGLTSGPHFSPTIHSYADDEGCFRAGQAWFRLKGYPHALAGYLVILAGDGEGGEASVPHSLTAEHVESLVTWVTPEDAKSDFPPTTFSTIGADGTRTLVSSTPVNFDTVLPYPTKARK